MNKSPASAISPGAGAFARVFDVERPENALRLNLLRLAIVTAFLLLEVLPFIPRKQMMDGWALGILLAYTAVSCALFLLSRHSERITRFSRLAIPFIDLPLVFFIQRINLGFSDDPRAVSNFTFALFMCLILLAALSLARWQIVVTAVLAVALEILRQSIAGEKLYGHLAGALLIVTIAAICEFARGRRIEMEWILCGEQLRRERLGRYFSPEVAVVIEKTADWATPVQQCE